MKKATYLWLFLLVFTMAACGGGVKGKLVGIWQFEKPMSSGKNSKDKEKSVKATLEFRKDGTFVQSAGGKSRNGKWEVTSGNKSVIIRPEKGTSETMEIVKIEKDIFIFKDAGKSDEITLKKVN